MAENNLMPNLARPSQSAINVSPGTPRRACPKCGDPMRLDRQDDGALVWHCLQRHDPRWFYGHEEPAALDVVVAVSGAPRLPGMEG